VSEPVKAIALRAQHRLHARYRTLLGPGKCPQQVATAVARDKSSQRVRDENAAADQGHGSRPPAVQRSRESGCDPGGEQHRPQEPCEARAPSVLKTAIATASASPRSFVVSMKRMAPQTTNSGVPMNITRCSENSGGTENAST
jgi:hypothetical protein